MQLFALAFLVFPLLPAASEAEERFLIMELMDRYGVVHDFGTPEPDGEFSSIMRHVISNRVVSLAGPASAEGSSYVITLINDREEGPQMLSISRYLDGYVKAGGQWKISRREIILESGNQAPGRKYGFIRWNSQNEEQPWQFP